MYPRYTNARGRVYNQLVVPESTADISLTSHKCVNDRAGHLGMKKTKASLSQEYSWLSCWKDVEQLFDFATRVNG